MAVDISSSWLSEHGVEAPRKELEELSGIAMAELELRVGTEIAGKLSDEQIADFEKLPEDDEAQQDWLERAMPDYPKIVDKKYAEMTTQLANSTDKITLIRSWDI